jgi:hypothetical protein
VTNTTSPHLGDRPSGTKSAIVAAAVVLTLACATFFLAACGSNGDTLGNQACVHVERSLELYKQSTMTSGQVADSLAIAAVTELSDARRSASLAASGDTNWQALAATLSESSRVSEANLVRALTAECASSPVGPRA